MLNSPWVKTFIQKLSSAKSEDIEIDKAFKIKEKNLPRFIYKYRKCGKDSFNDLLNDRAWLSPPNLYNDPYDCNLTFSNEIFLKAITKGNFIESINKSALKEKFGSLLEDDPKTKEEVSLALGGLLVKLFEKSPNLDGAKKLFDSISAGISKEIILKFNDALQRDMKVCSFSATGESIIMWGHYSENHSGFCIEYDLKPLKKDHPLRSMLFPVFYSEKLFDATKYFLEALENKNKQNNIFNYLCSLYKSKEWSYEKEFRLIFFDRKANGAGQAFKMPKPNRVLVGSKVSKENYEIIRNICEEKNIPLFQMELSEKVYKMSASQKSNNRILKI